MTRPRKISTDDLIRLIDEFYVIECKKDPSKLKYVKIAQYICLKGYLIKEYDIRRSVEAINHIEKLKENIKETYKLSIYMFKSLDVDEFLRKHSTINKLKHALIERDTYYSDIVDSTSFYINNYQAIEQKSNKQKKELLEYKQQIDELMMQISNLKDINHSLQAKVNTLNNVLKTNVYPEIANELLYQDGSIVNKTSDTIDTSSNILGDNISLEEVIKGNEKSKSKNTVIQGLFNKI